MLDKNIAKKAAAATLAVIGTSIFTIAFIYYLIESIHWLYATYYGPLIIVCALILLAVFGLFVFLYGLEKERDANGKGNYSDY